MTNTYTPDKDGFLVFRFRPSTGSVNATVHIYDSTEGVYIASAVCLNGSAVTQCVPAKAGNTYQCASSSDSGTTMTKFMPIY